jgi:amidase
MVADSDTMVWRMASDSPDRSTPPLRQQFLHDKMDGWPANGTGLLGVLARLGLLDKTVDRIATDNLRYVPFTQLSNLTGTPSMSVPLHWTADGLPLGVQFMGPFGSEDRLLQVAGQLEAAQPWFDRLAPLARG